MCQAWKELLEDAKNKGIRISQKKMQRLETKNTTLKSKCATYASENRAIKRKIAKMETRCTEAETRCSVAESELVLVSCENEEAKQKLRALGWSEERIQELFSRS